MTLAEIEKIKANYKVVELAVDFINPSYNISRAKCLDNTRYLLCTLTEDGVPRLIKNGEVARIRLQKPDKHAVYNDCVVVEDGKLLITLTEQILAVAGNAICDIQVVNEDTGIIYSTKNFIINIDKTAIDNSLIASSNEFDALNRLIATNKQVNNELIANEEIRKSNETVRIDNENVRKNNEVLRNNTEDIRKANEELRKENEIARETQENDRQNNTLIAITNANNAAKNANDKVEDLQSKLESHHFVLSEDKDTANGIPSLDSDGKIPIDEIYEASTIRKGIVQLEDSIESSSVAMAATSSSVKKVYDNLIAYQKDIITMEDIDSLFDDFV